MPRSPASARVSRSRRRILTMSALGVLAIVLFGLFMSGAMLLVLWRFMHNQSKGDSLRLIAEEGDGRAH